ncbi:glycosyltransferase family 2 protein [Roseateles sp. NT4]|uniref:glycosyltransferase family 2 protein n=1 Tax=Roseateles sp. NT4 TaxID=3453715 RepID=UPI003EEA220D
MTAPLLTIAIPTFDRNEVLAQTVAALLPQLGPDVSLVIRDNASPRPVAQTLAELVAGADVRIVRNPWNIGGNANILRCLETCETEWLWILGDDDLPDADAVARVLGDVRAAHADLVGVNYRSELYDRRLDLELRGGDDFLARMDSLSNVLFLSASVLRAPALQRHLRLAYAYAYSNMPHVLALLLALGGQGRVRLSTQHIATWCEADAGSSWSVVNASLAFPTVLDLPLPQRQRRLLARKVEADVHPELLGLARQLLALACADGDAAAARWAWRQMRLRRFGGGPLSARRLLAWLLGWLFVAPPLARPVVEAVARAVLGDRSSRNALQDRTQRI